MDRELALALLMEQIVRSAYKSRKSEEVQPLQWSILRYLNSSSVAGREIGSVASYVGVTSAPASRAVKTLAKRRFVKKEPSGEDRRSVSLQITSEGIEALKHDPILKIAEKFKSLSDPEFAAVSIALRKLALLREDATLVDNKSSDS